MAPAIKTSDSRDFPGGPAAKTAAPNSGNPGLIPGQRTRSHMLQPDLAQPNK